MDKDLTKSELFVVSWNTTNMCNLKCEHCYLDACYLDGTVKDELTTEEGFKLIDEIYECNPATVLILTGGEPLLREDIYKLGKYAADKGLMPVLGTNGTLLTDEVVKKMIAHDIAGAGVSIDSLKPEIHDKFRGLPGSLEKTLKGVEALKKNNVGFQVQTTVTKDNYEEIPAIVDFCYELGCKIFNLFFLVCTGRGHGLSDITPAQYEEMLSRLAKIDAKYEGKMMIKAKCAPHSKRVAYTANPDAPLLKGYTSDCLAGVHYCRVTPKGDVTSCPYMPLAVGNVKEKSFVDIWKNSKVFHDLRKAELKGKCGECEFKIICGGCRARSYSATEDYLLDDPWCEYEPPKDGRPMIKLENTDDKYWVDEEYELVWSDDAQTRLKKIPKFIRNMIVKGIERFAREKGYKTITPEVMQESRNNNKSPMGGMGGMKMGMGMGMGMKMPKFLKKDQSKD